MTTWTLWRNTPNGPEQLSSGPQTALRQTLAVRRAAGEDVWLEDESGNRDGRALPSNTPICRENAETAANVFRYDPVVRLDVAMALEQDRTALIAALEGCLPVLEDAEHNARFRAKEQGAAVASNWLNVANRFCEQSAAIRALLRRVKGAA